MKNDGVRTFIKTCGDQNFVQIKNHTKWIHFRCMQMRHCEVEGISSKPTTTIVSAFGDSTSFIWSFWELNPEVSSISSKSTLIIVREFGNSLSSSLSFASSKKGAPII
jgi:hypothetical protein